MQKNSCRNTALNKEKRNYMKKLPFYLPIHQQKQGIKAIFFHKVSFSIVPEQFLITFQQKIDSKKKKISYSSTLFSEMNSQYCPAAFIPFFYHSFTHWLSHNMKKQVARREIDGKENRDIPSPPSSGAFPGVPELNGTIAL